MIRPRLGLDAMLLSGWLVQWVIVLSLTALCLSLVVVAQIVACHSIAYRAAPRDVAAYIEAVDSSVQENESYHRDVAKVQRLEDKLRLGRLLREIQRGGDDLREDLNRLLAVEGTTSLRASARLLWASKRVRLEDRVRRLDLLRMRFLVYMASIADRQPEKMPALAVPSNPTLHKSLTDAVAKRAPLRRLTTHAIGHQETVATPHRKGWAGVVEELQTSPRMQRRHASLEQTTTARHP